MRDCYCVLVNERNYRKPSTEGPVPLISEVFDHARLFLKGNLGKIKVSMDPDTITSSMQVDFSINDFNIQIENQKDA